MLKRAILLLLVFALLARLEVSVLETNWKEYHKSASAYLTGRSTLANPNQMTYEFGNFLHNSTSDLVVDFINPGNSISTEFGEHKLLSPIHKFIPKGSITILSTLIHTRKLLPNSIFMITPNPYTLKDSLIVSDNDPEKDSSQSWGVIALKNVRFSSYLINETHSSPGYGPVLMKARISVHSTAKDPIVVVENRNLSKSFIGPAEVFAPYLNDSSFESFISRDATVGGKSITKVNDLPSTTIFNTLNATHSNAKMFNNTLLPEVNLNGSIAPSESTPKIFSKLMMPVYPAPVKGIASNITYISPVFTINQRGLENNNFTLTPIIAKVFPGMVLLLNPNAGIASKIASVKSVQMQFEKNSTNIGLSFGLSNTFPDTLKLPSLPANPLLMFMNIGYSGIESGTIPVNFSNPSFFKSSPAIHILVNKHIPIIVKRFSDGCPGIELFAFNEAYKRWESSTQPEREPTSDHLNWCGYVLHTPHFSKFAVGGIKQSSSLNSER